MSYTTSQVGNIIIRTQVVPAPDPYGSNVFPSTTTVTPMTSKHFKKIPVKALSTVLMLIGILQMLTGVVFYASETNIISLTLKSGVYIWGGVVVFVAGAACLNAILKDTITMVKVCMSCNIISIVVTAVGLILFTIQTYYESQACWIRPGEKEYNGCQNTEDEKRNYNYNNYNDYYNYYSSSTDIVMRLRVSVNIIIMLFSLLGLVISCFMTIVSDKVLKSTGYSLLR
ncbi:uncharacterized protein LOC143930409 [Lithobates pipiens]